MSTNSTKFRHFQYTYLSIPHLVISTLLIISIKSQCNNCVHVSNCRICYNNCTAQTNPNGFISCQQTTCQYYTNGGCSQYTNVVLSQGVCLSQCCGLSQDYFTIRELLTCQDNISKNATLKTILMIIVVVGVCIVVFILGYCLFCRRNREDNRNGCCCCFKNNNPQSSMPTITNIPSSQNRLARDQKSPQLQKLQWKHDQYINTAIQNNDSICTVCLSNCVNCMALCNHYFHIHCLAQWIYRNPHCPICRSKKIVYVKYYCKICCIQYLEVDLRIFRNFKVVNTPICQKCS